MGESKKKKCCEYKAGEKYFDLCLEEKLVIIFYNPKELLNQRSKTLNVCRHNKS